MSSSPSLFLNREQIFFVNIFIPIQYVKYFYLISSQSTDLYLLFCTAVSVVFSLYTIFCVINQRIWFHNKNIKLVGDLKILVSSLGSTTLSLRDSGFKGIKMSGIKRAATQSYNGVACHHNRITHINRTLDILNISQQLKM